MHPSVICLPLEQPHSNPSTVSTVLPLRDRPRAQTLGPAVLPDVARISPARPQYSSETPESLGNIYGFAMPLASCVLGTSIPRSAEIPELCKIPKET
jgi:hypothetical protein